MKFLVYLVILIALVAGLFLFWPKSNKVDQNLTEGIEQAAPTTYTRSLEITEGATYGFLMAQAGVPTTTRQEIFAAAQSVYDLTKIRLGRSLDLVYDLTTDELEQLGYQIDTEERLYVSLNSTTTASSTEPVWSASVKPIPYEIKIKTVACTIETSMYESALAQNIDERAVIGFADAFQWTIDFAWEVRQGDTYKFIYEERYLDGEYIMPGQILAGKFVNAGKDLYAFYYQETAENFGYFDEAGNSAERTFLKAPLAFKYITSGFTTGSRYIAAFNIATGHRAIDYAATFGTPVRAVGDGTVIFAGWDGSYGYKISVRHNATYTTNYAHLSKFAIKSGQKVSQGQTIGYVGSTGLSTGPHLHYELVKNGTKINPLTEVFPPKEGIKEENKPAYLAVTKDLKEKLDN